VKTKPSARKVMDSIFFGGGGLSRHLIHEFSHGTMNHQLKSLFPP
jgi:hypothetical protein